MPTPRSDETRDDFIDRCIPIVIDDGTAEDGAQALAICGSMFDNKETEMTDEIETTEEVKTDEDIQADDKPESKGIEVAGVVTSVVPWEATSFDDIDEYMKAETVRTRIAEVTRQFEALTHNIMWTDKDIDKVAEMKSLVVEFEKRLGEALDMKGNTIWDAMKNVFKKKDPPPEPKTKNGLFVWKEGDRYRWFAVYSNKYRDEDVPPEILSEKSHLMFVELVDKGEVPYPELWHWHIPGTRWGQADWVAYDTDFGFSLASGFVDSGHESEAKAIADLDEPLAVSHGLKVLKRDKDDETIINLYISEEISDLPVKAAANKLTGFSLIEAKENKMIPDDKKQHLLSVGLTEEKINEIESDLEGKASKADEAGLEFKANEDEVAKPVESSEVEGNVEAPDAETTEAKDEDEIEVDDLTLPVTRQEVMEGNKIITDAIVGINETLEGLTKDDDEKIKDIVEDTPAFSIAHMVSENLSVIGKEEAETDEKDGPAENKTDEKSITGVPWIDTMLVEE